MTSSAAAAAAPAAVRGVPPAAGAKGNAGPGGRTSIDELLKITIFNRSEIETLIKRFNSLATNQNDKIDRARFRDMLSDHFGIDDSLLMDRVFRCFDQDTDNYVSFDEFMKGMSIFLRGVFDERMKFCFRVYDLNSDKYITREEMFQMLKNCLVRGAEEDEDGVKDLVDLVLKKLDEDRDGRVNEADYVAAVQKESLLLEAFGQCLPTPRAAEQFVSLTAAEGGGGGGGGGGGIGIGIGALQPRASAGAARKHNAAPAVAGTNRKKVHAPANRALPPPGAAPAAAAKKQVKRGVAVA